MNLPQAAALKADFDRDGFVIIRDFATPEEVREICTRAEKATKDVIRKDQFSNITKGLEKRDSYFGELLKNGPQVPILETLHRQETGTHHGQFFHQDLQRPGSASALRRHRWRRDLDRPGRDRQTQRLPALSEGVPQARGGVRAPAGRYADGPVRSSRCLRSGDEPRGHRDLQAHHGSLVGSES